MITSEIIFPLDQHAQNSPEHPAIIGADLTISYKLLINSVCAIQAELEKRGIKPKDRIAVCVDKSIDTIVILLALWRMGAVSCLLNPKSPHEQINTQSQELKCKILVSSLKDILQSQTVTLEKIDLPFLIQHYAVAFEDSEIKKSSLNPEEEMTIIYTSGSNAKPKAVIHTYANHHYNAIGNNEHLDLKSTDTWLLSLPLYHVGGLSIIFRCLLAGATIVVPDSNSSLTEAILNHNISYMSLVPTQLLRLIKETVTVDKMKTLKGLLLGGAAINESLLKKACDHKLSVFVTYGLTEMASSVATSEKLTQDSLHANLKTLNHREIKIADDREIYVKGPTLFKEYAGIDQALDEEGWFHTGDLGREDKNHNIKIVGRKDNMFISGGENIQPEEIEHYLCQCIEVENAIVVPVKDEEFGFRPVAFIQQAHNQEFSRKQTEEILQQKVPKFKLPDRYYLWPGLLNNQTLKVDREALKELAKNYTVELGS